MQALEKSNIENGNKLSQIGSLSIKKLTFLGFTLVALPLVLALLYSANQVNELSKRGASSIFTVAELISTNQKISNTLKNMERYASQYLVLRDNELIAKYIVEQKILLATNEQLYKHDDNEIQKLVQLFSENILQVHHSIIKSTPTVYNTNLSTEITTLEDLQKQFKRLTTINEALNKRSGDFINLQAKEIKSATEKVSHTLLKSLLIIPFSLLIAGIFIVLITNPLKKLIIKIQQLQQGDFTQDNPILEKPLTGFIEIKEINDALNNMKSRLHALELQKSSFIRHISHELKTPLAAIREGTELIYDNSVGTLNKDQQEIIKIIRTSTTRLQRLIEELLDFNIVLDSTSLQDKESVNLADLIEQAITERTLDIKRKRINIDRYYSNIVIESNTKQLAVIIDNLLSNAINYSPVDGTIKIFVQCRQHQLEFSISDQGDGIKEEQKDKIFDAFYQGTAPKNYNIKSSGLGLTIVKELLMRLNGNIFVDSQTVNPSGTTVKIVFSNITSDEIL